MTDTPGQIDPPSGSPCRLLIMGTDTEVGKTYVTATILMGLRAYHRRVWLHKPIACGEWDGQSSGDGRTLQALVGDGQPEALVCPLQLAEACSPHIALRRAQRHFSLAQALENLDRCLKGSHDCLVEGAGGIVSPLTSDDADITHFARARNLPAILVTRPHLGTINHTRLSIAYLRQQGVAVLGLVVNAHQAAAPSPAHDGIAAELQRLCDLPILGQIDYLPGGPDLALGKSLAQTILRALEHRPV